MKKTVFLLLFCCLMKYSSSKNTLQNHLSRGSSLSVGDGSHLINSPDNTFTCGFYSFQTNAYWFAIWYTNSKDRTVVWTANRNKPVNGHGSKMTLQKNGAMVLTDVDGRYVWQTNTTSTDVYTAVLLNTGNLVLMNKKGEFLWQSFDYPTDTLLPSQTLTKSKSLISSSKKGSFESGYFVLSYNIINVLVLWYDGPEISRMYWPMVDIGINDLYYGRTSYNSSRTAVFDDFGTFRSTDQLQFNASDMGFGIKRRLTMDYDGNLRIYSLNESTGLWLISWQAMAQSCDVHGICGRNGICVYGDKPECACPPGYKWTDPTYLSQGCKPTFNTNCSNSTRFGFFKVPHTGSYGFDLDYFSPISLDACKDICLGNCSCIAFSYYMTGEGLCYTKRALFNGFRSPSFPATMYLKVPISMETTESAALILASPKATCPEIPVMVDSPSMYQPSDTKVKWVYPYSFAIAIGVAEAFVILLGWWLFYRKNALLTNLEDGYRMVSSQFRGFGYQELMRATQNFKVEIGRGGSGRVYKGVLEDERVVAVKRLGDVSEGGEFWAEMSTIGKLNHMNLVRMWGFCSHKRHRFLVYEYVENLSLDHRLFSTSFLQWNERFKVVVGIAKGLAYLHHECLEWVIHCDVKPENILLDGSFEPKIADFGLAKLSKRGGQNSEFTRIRGTKGYMAPEWASNLPITAKVDVYSYGVVLLEIIKGIRLSSLSVHRGEEEESELRRFAKATKKQIREEKRLWIEDIVDPRLGGLFSRKQAATLIEVGLSCVEEDRHKRPTMDSVVQVLVDCELE